MYQNHSVAPVSRRSMVASSSVVRMRRQRATDPKGCLADISGRIVGDEATFLGARAFPGGGGRLRRTVRRVVSRRLSGGVQHPRQPDRGGGLLTGSAGTSTGEMETNARLRAGLGGPGL